MPPKVPMSFLLIEVLMAVMQGLKFDGGKTIIL